MITLSTSLWHFLLIFYYLLFLLLSTQKKMTRLFDLVSIPISMIFFLKKPLKKQLKGERCLFVLACDSK